jgi:hypothetical protein
MSKAPSTKIDKVAHHLVTKKKITSWDAIQLYFATRLADIIFTLRNEGWLINTKMIKKDKVRYAEYILVKAKTND